MRPAHSRAIDGTSDTTASNTPASSKFRNLLERHGLGRKMLAAVNGHLERHGLKIGTGTIVDATILQAPSSTKNKQETATKQPSLAVTVPIDPRSENPWSVLSIQPGADWWRRRYALFWERTANPYAGHSISPFQRKFRRKEAVMPISEPTTDHLEIRHWAQKHNAVPVEMMPDHVDSVPTTIRLLLPEQIVRPGIKRISWEEFFVKFDELGLTFVYDSNSTGYNEILQVESRSPYRHPAYREGPHKN